MSSLEELKSQLPKLLERGFCYRNLTDIGRLCRSYLQQSFRGSSKEHIRDVAVFVLLSISEKTANLVEAQNGKLAETNAIEAAVWRPLKALANNIRTSADADAISQDAHNLLTAYFNLRL